MANSQQEQWPPPPQPVPAAVSHGGSRPRAVQCAAARILRGNAHYIIVVRCEDGRRWAVAKRFSHFDNFRKMIGPLLARLAPGTDQLPFPPKTPFGSSTGEQTVELRMETFEQWLNAVIDIVTDDHIAESVVDGCTLVEEAALAEQKLCIFLAEDESVDVEILQSLGLEVRSNMLTEQAKKDRAGHIEQRELPEIIRRRRPAAAAGRRLGGGMNGNVGHLGILDDGSGMDDESGPSPRGGVWKEHEPLPLQSWDVEPPPHLAAMRQLQGRTRSGRTPPASPAQPEETEMQETHDEHGSFVLKNPDRTSSSELDSNDSLHAFGAKHNEHLDELEIVEGDGNPVGVSFGVGKIGIQYRVAQGWWASNAAATSGRDKVLVIESIVPGGLAAMCSAPQLQPGFVLTQVNGESIKGHRYEHVMRRMRESPRPLKLAFEAPLSPAARMTAAIKSHTAAVAAAVEESLFSPLIPSARGEVDTPIAQLDESELQGEASRHSGLHTTHSPGHEDDSSDVGSGDGNLSSTPDSTGSKDMTLDTSKFSGNTIDEHRQAAMPERTVVIQSGTRGLKGLNGGVTPRRPGTSETARRVPVDESVEAGPITEGNTTEVSSFGQQQQKWQAQKQQICLSFTREGPIGLELTVSSAPGHPPTQPHVVVRAIRPGTQANVHAPLLRPGLVLMRVADADVRGLSLDEVYSAIVENNQRPLMITFSEPHGTPNHRAEDQRQPDNDNEQHRQVFDQLLWTDKEGADENASRSSVRKYLAAKGMAACTDGVCRALSQHGTECSQWLSTLTSMAPATQRDLLEAVRAQYARESPVRSLGEVRLDESVEQPQELKSSLSLQVHDETEELSLEYPENVLTVSETEKKAIHGAL